MKRFIIIYFWALVTGLFSIAHAQYISTGQLMLPGELSQDGDSVYLRMDVDISNLDLLRNQGIIITPVLSGQGRQAEFKSIMLNGKVRSKVYKRALRLDEDTRLADNDYYRVINTHNERNKKFTYRSSIPFEQWMLNSQLDLIEDIESCRNKLELAVENVMHLEALEWEPVTSFRKPMAEEVKLRNDRFEAYLEFVVAKTDILPDFRNNRQELNTLETGLNTIRDDRNLTVTDIAVTGHASPEGSVELNNRLSQGRADALMNYLISRYNFPRNVYHVEKGGEDWEKLESLVQESSLPARDEILNIIRMTSDPTERQAKITRLNGGATYRELLNTYYPKLRRVVCVVNYSVKAFTVEEGKEILKTNPRQLSLEEMYQIAQTYPKGSEAYTQTFDIAIRLYPDDPTANLNAAAIALENEDYDVAERFLEKTDRNSAEYYNNLGVIYLARENYQQADQAFSRASQMGSSDATKNLEMLRNRIKTTP